MNHRNLRSSVIRLAHANPELRPHLLPLLGVRTADDKSFDEAVKGKKFKNPETGNEVMFGSLPAEEQKKVRESWSKKNKGDAEKGGGGKTVEVAQKELDSATKAHEDHQSEKSWEHGLDPDRTMDDNLQDLEEVFDKFGYSRSFDKKYPNLKALKGMSSSFDELTLPEIEEKATKAKKDLSGFLEDVKSSDQYSRGGAAEKEYVGKIESVMSYLDANVNKSKKWEAKDKELSKSVDTAKASLSEAKKPKKEETPADIKEKAEDFAKNIKDPEEREKAIKRVKNMTPAEMKGMLAGAGDDEGGKKASLRSRAIRLAHANPALRPHLLPLLKSLV